MRRLVRDVLLIAGVAACAYLAVQIISGYRAAGPDGATRYGLCGARPRINCVVDGDTFYAGGQIVRIADIDAPEVSPPGCDDEARLGREATQRLAALLSAGPVQLRAIDRDRDQYGRLLRIVERDGRSLGAQLVAEGLARPWTGRRQPWCEELPEQPRPGEKDVR